MTTPTHRTKQENGWGNGFMHEGKNITIKCFCTHQQQGSLYKFHAYVLKKGVFSNKRKVIAHNKKQRSKVANKIRSNMCLLGLEMKSLHNVQGCELSHKSFSCEFSVSKTPTSL